MDEQTEAQFEYMQKTVLWERINFAISVLNGTWTNFPVEQLGDHLANVVAGCKQREEEREAWRKRQRELLAP